MNKMRKKIAVSSCLLGINCKYNGLSNYNEAIIKLQDEYELIPICPEVLGGLSTPRIPAERVGDKVINKEKADVTNNYHLGALKALERLKKENINIAILKSKSPSCGKGFIYDGTFSSSLIEGNGVTTDLFLDNGITVVNEFNFKDFL